MVGTFPAELVANGSGRSLTVIMCTAPGSSNRKSVKGAGGGGAVSGAVTAATGAGATMGALTSVFRYVTSCQRCGSGSEAHDGIAPLLDPLVMNQKTSPSATFCTRPCASAGILPLPSALRP